MTKLFHVCKVKNINFLFEYVSIDPCSLFLKLLNGKRNQLHRTFLSGPTSPPPTTPIPSTCAPPFIPVQCKPECPAQCHYLPKCHPPTGSYECHVGCACPNGTLKDGKTCRKPSACQCLDKLGNIRKVIYYLKMLMIF